ncbi:bacillithiol biosynthesis deacetylase BshB1 [Brevibacillus laterosporus]|uniref:bacillithiol biosynthesis deacetylase BshB1 n=1 Tax=Brevibacillus laterosporus TaxID=1465 RepID=UPI00265012A1|nr:bacillithiol biosynthesis deacetylase BshB1 [Brevibacillus laterosporus]MDN9008929.1 bacillithiol biosynthesis deacetylase BshB1 [Brevibacillus laterosporus]MDO0941036.1 bacillithiol biosynthesis deacetylase BshB1 [Brevibacillus laterosporus]
MEENHLDILAIGAHPDDVEIGAAGVLLRANQQGKKAGILDMTYAELSSNGTVVRRQEEAAIASEHMKLTARYNFGLPDRGLEANRELAIKKVVDLIRKTRPKVVLAPYFHDRHPDHESVSRIVKEAIFSAGIKKFVGERELPAYRPEHFYYYFINSTAIPSFFVDITDLYPQKIQVLESYRSQFEQEEGSVSTPLNNGYIELVEYRERLFGQQAGVKYAEGFVNATPLVLSSL